MRIKNPLGTGEGFKRPPKPPALVQDYYERVKEAVDKVTRRSFFEKRLADNGQPS